jgi:hypothetical protein
MKMNANMKASASCKVISCIFLVCLNERYSALEFITQMVIPPSWNSLIDNSR